MSNNYYIFKNETDSHILLNNTRTYVTHSSSNSCTKNKLFAKVFTKEQANTFFKANRKENWHMEKIVNDEKTLGS